MKTAKPSTVYVNFCINTSEKVWKYIYQTFKVVMYFYNVLHSYGRDLVTYYVSNPKNNKANLDNWGGRNSISKNKNC